MYVPLTWYMFSQHRCTYDLCVPCICIYIYVSACMYIGACQCLYVWHGVQALGIYCRALGLRYCNRYRIYIYIKIFNLNNRWFVPCTSIHTCTCWACEVKLSTVLDPSNVETQVVDEATDNVNIDASPVMSDASLHIITYGSSSALT